MIKKRREDEEKKAADIARVEKLDKSEGAGIINTSYRDYIERKSREDANSKMKQLNFEDYISQTFSAQFFDLVLSLASEQQAESRIDNLGKTKAASSDRKLISKRDRRF